MPEIRRLRGSTDWIYLDLVERERIHESVMKLGIQLHLAEISFLNTLSDIDGSSVQRSRKAIHDWV